MTADTFILLTFAVFLGNIAAGFAGKLLMDWTTRRAWMRMESRFMEQAKRMKGEFDLERPRRTAIYPKPRAN